jgi:plasmid stabilization system protein ParE
VAYSIVWTNTALSSVAEAAEYIAKDSPSYAAALITRTDYAANSLVEFPQRGRVVPEYRDSAIRELFVDSYRLIYRIFDDTVTIVAFVHGARDLAALLPTLEQS